MTGYVWGWLTELAVIEYLACCRRLHTSLSLVQAGTADRATGHRLYYKVAPAIRLEIKLKLKLKLGQAVRMDGNRWPRPMPAGRLPTLKRHVCGCLSFQFPVMHFSCVSFEPRKWGRYPAIPNNNETPLCVLLTNCCVCAFNIISSDNNRTTVTRNCRATY